MDTNADELSNVKGADVEAEIVRGERDDVLEEYPRSGKERIRIKPRAKLMPRTVKRDASQVTVRTVSPRIEELARPTKQRVLHTLRERSSTLPPAFVDNLTRIIEGESCLTPEEAAQVLRRKRHKTRKTTRFPPFARKWMRGITKLDTVHATTTLDRDATLCQYLMAERFVRSILEHRCRTQRKDFREIAQVILKRLKSFDGYVGTENGNDRATQQLGLLADIVACWIIEILVEVAETRKEALEEYRKRKRMKMLEVDDDEDNQTDSETEGWEQVQQVTRKEEMGQSEEKNNGREKEDTRDEVATRRDEEEGKQPDEKEVENKDVENERVTEERENEENGEKEGEGE